MLLLDLFWSLEGPARQIWIFSFIYEFWGPMGIISWSLIDSSLLPGKGDGTVGPVLVPGVSGLISL